MERIAGCPNLRDMGGIKVKNGYVKPGRLIRSGALWRLEDKDIEKLGSIAAVYDMRSENERAYHPDPEIPGAEYIHIPITENGRRRFVQSKRTLPDKVEDMLEGYRCSEPASAQRMREVYSGMVLSADAGRCLEGIIRTVVEQREGAVIYHCSAGKDRAGVISALLLRLLGAEDSAIYADYIIYIPTPPFPMSWRRHSQPPLLSAAMSAQQITFWAFSPPAPAGLLRRWIHWIKDFIR